jgi:hypothetical protein
LSGDFNIDFSEAATAAMAIITLGMKVPRDTLVKRKRMIHFSFPEGARAAEAFQSLFSHTDGKIRDRYGEDGCGRMVVWTERLILNQHSPYL